ncbi:hypothetical protein [Streptomyces sp. bgisy100]|uniref:hypothetical protein n=1 Tax=Streptomyces sp. bgisy100 TaxID=3413783 RepID=UPI003D7539BD
MNGTLAHADFSGVGPDWSAYLIVNLSVGAGDHHRPPAASESCLSYKVSELSVHRPLPWPVVTTEAPAEAG